MKIDLMGLQINTENKKQVLLQLEENLKARKKTFIVTPYSEFFYYAAKDYKFRNAINNAEIALADGISVLWLAYFLSIPLAAKNYYLKILESFWQMIYSLFFIILTPKKIHSLIPEKISGSDFFWDLVKFAAENKLKIFFLGGFNETPQIVAKKIKEKFPQIEIAGYSNLGPKEISAQEINQSKTDVLMVAYGPVTQEIWLAENLQNLNIKIAMAVGGTFDYVAGKKIQPPAFLRKFGLEWAFRLITQPRRVKRIWIATFVFLRGALRHKVLNSCPFRENVASVIINKQNKIFIGERVENRYFADTLMAMSEDPAAVHWQLPQGGVDKKETTEQAIKRELLEELGTTNFKILGQASKKYSYLWTHMFRSLLGNIWKNRGQRQTIFYVKYDGNDSEIKLQAEEFKSFKWVDPEEALQLIHPLRKEMLKLALSELNKFLQPAP
jgi:N-acetylglucosaminyldiphosphoundecaprenol N-acetyl-beta-D-mannosaminyltransferase